MAERVYCPDTGSGADGAKVLEVVGDEARHLCRVRRVGVGEFVEVFDGKGSARRAEVIVVGKDRVSLRPVGPPLPDRLPSLSLTLATAVPKGDRFDWLVEKSAEMGVASLVPILSERSVVDPRGTKLDRLRRGMVEAAKQCGRNRLMSIDRPTPWPEFARGVTEGVLRLIAHPGGKTFAEWPRDFGAAVVAIGPEGGFTEGEVEVAASHGWIPVSLGPTLLRIETAGLVAASRLLALSESSDAGLVAGPSGTFGEGQGG
jgi:16S rRNA (uracil1498-N3)-methyltransferase